MRSDVETTVRERYAAAARTRVEALCCAPTYDARYLDVLPPEIRDRDYGCGDPTRYVDRGERVLDLGSGSGKTCYVLSQVVGPGGRVLGVDMSDEMLDLARRHQPAIAEAIGWDNVTFLRARIQDLATDLDDPGGRRGPLVHDGSVDVVVSNCVLNLVPDPDKPALFDEIHRVLAPGGRAVVSDIVASELVPGALKADPELWSGCIAGAMTEAGFLDAFARAGFEAAGILERAGRPWRTIEAIEFRSLTVGARKAGGRSRDLEVLIPRESAGSTGCC